MEQQPLNDIRQLLQQKIFGNPCVENFNPCSRALFNRLSIGKPITSFKNCLVLHTASIVWHADTLPAILHLARTAPGLLHVLENHLWLYGRSCIAFYIPVVLYI